MNMALESDRPGIQIWLCHLLSEHLAKRLHQLEPQVPHLWKGVTIASLLVLQ